MMGSLDKEEQQMLEDALKELPPIKQRRIMKKVEEMAGTSTTNGSGKSEVVEKAPVKDDSPARSTARSPARSPAETTIPSVPPAETMTTARATVTATATGTGTGPPMMPTVSVIGIGRRKTRMTIVIATATATVTGIVIGIGIGRRMTIVTVTATVIVAIGQTRGDRGRRAGADQGRRAGAGLGRSRGAGPGPGRGRTRPTIGSSSGFGRTTSRVAMLLTNCGTRRTRASFGTSWRRETSWACETRTPSSSLESAGTQVTEGDPAWVEEATADAAGAGVAIAGALRLTGCGASCGTSGWTPGPRMHSR